MMMMMKMKMEIGTSFMCKTLTLFILCMVLQDGCGFPLSEQEAPPAHAARLPHVRTKRCSCSSWEDKECVYFCHLDIIWVNTPSKLLPYGLGGSPSSDRRRRSADRCRCLSPADGTCAGFCRESAEDSRPDGVEEPQSAGGSSVLVLVSLRSVVRSNLAIAHETLTRSGEVKTPRSRTGR